MSGIRRFDFFLTANTATMVTIHIIINVHIVLMIVPDFIFCIVGSQKRFLNLFPTHLSFENLIPEFEPARV